MSLEDLMLTELSQSQKEKYIVWFYMKSLKWSKSQRRRAGAPGTGVGNPRGDGELLLFNENRVSVQENENCSGGGWIANVLNATELHIYKG